jgi:hypothetical protein
MTDDDDDTIMTTITTTLNKQYNFFHFSYGEEKHNQMTMEHNLILSLMSK